MNYPRFGNFTFALLSLAWCQSVYAQESGTVSTARDAQSNNQADGEIIVTALRRSTGLQETPAAITAIPEARIRDLAIVDSRELTRLAPGLIVTESNAGNNRFTIRSIGSAGEPTVGVYLDEIALVGPPGTTNDAGSLTPSVRLFDIERTEVLRGPQGTLYGAGSMAGTLRFILAKPKLDQFEGEVMGRVADINHGGIGYEINAMANAPLVDGLLGLRVVGFYSDQDGYTDNAVLNIKDSNFMVTKGGRVMLRAEPAEGLTIDGLFNFQDAKGVIPEWRKDVGDYRADFRVRNRFSDNYQLYGLTTNYDFDWATFTAAISYSDRDSEYFWDSSPGIINSINVPLACQIFFSQSTACSPTQREGYATYANSLGASASNPPAHTTVFTQEGRLTGSWNKMLDWTVGVYHFKRDARIDSYNWPVDPLNGEAIVTADGYRFYRYIIDELEQTAVFSEVTAHPTAALSITLGARYFDYSRLTGGETPKGNAASFSVKAPYSEAVNKENGWIFKFGADYKLTSDVMIYVSANEGFRPGGVNQAIGVPADLVTYSADSLWSYEFGFKTSWLDRAVTVNGAVYQVDWSDRQTQARTTSGSFAFIGNVGSARIRGAELEVLLRPVGGFQINAGGSFNDGKLTENQVTNTGTAAGKKGDRLDITPRWTFQLGGQYTQPVSEGVDAVVRIDANYIGERWATLARTNAQNKLPAFWNTSARIGINDQNSGWRTSLYVTNLFDVIGLQQGNAGSILTGFNQQRVSSITPRTVGVELSKRF